MTIEAILQQGVKNQKQELLISPASFLKPLEDQPDEEVAVFLNKKEAWD